MLSLSTSHNLLGVYSPFSQRSHKTSISEQTMIKLINALSSNIKSYYTKTKHSISQHKEETNSIILTSIESELKAFVNEAKEIFKQLKILRHHKIIFQELSSPSLRETPKINYNLNKRNDSDKLETPSKQQHKIKVNYTNSKSTPSSVVKNKIRDNSNNSRNVSNPKVFSEKTFELLSQVIQLLKILSPKSDAIPLSKLNNFVQNNKQLISIKNIIYETINEILCESNNNKTFEQLNINNENNHNNKEEHFHLSNQIKNKDETIKILNDNIKLKTKTIQRNNSQIITLKTKVKELQQELNDIKDQDNVNNKLHKTKKEDVNKNNQNNVHNKVSKKNSNNNINILKNETNNSQNLVEHGFKDKIVKYENELKEKEKTIKQLKNEMNKRANEYQTEIKSLKDSITHVIEEKSKKINEQQLKINSLINNKNNLHKTNETFNKISPQQYTIILDKTYNNYHWFLLSKTSKEVQNDYTKYIWVPENIINPILSQFNKFKSEKDYENEHLNDLQVSQANLLKKLEQREDEISKLKKEHKQATNINLTASLGNNSDLKNKLFDLNVLNNSKKKTEEPTIPLEKYQSLINQLNDAQEKLSESNRVISKLQKENQELSRIEYVTNNYQSEFFDENIDLDEMLPRKENLLSKNDLVKNFNLTQIMINKQNKTMRLLLQSLIQILFSENIEKNDINIIEGKIKNILMELGKTIGYKENEIVPLLSNHFIYGIGNNTERNKKSGIIKGLFNKKKKD